MRHLKSFLCQRAEFLSPKDLAQRACAVSVIFLLLHLAGLRDFASILNGTVGSLSLGRNLSAFLALIYIGFYLAFVVLAPVMVLAAAMLAVTARLRRRGGAKSNQHDQLK
jgi:hypothetical protein